MRGVGILVLSTLICSATTISINVQTTLNETESHSTTSHIPTNSTIIKSNTHSNSAVQLQITILIVIGLTILAVLLYFIFCRQIPNVVKKPRRPIYRSIISKPHTALNEI
ncbi:E3 6.6kDa protein [Human mastadenovirus B]|uniref:E3 6.6kDa protein n=1 Tax=Human mastadenovirus B TaxID=108098 RepID=A0A0K0PXA8_9ADEN|nr:E3 6.6kDa protein [Human mastadenovirus B]